MVATRRMIQTHPISAVREGIVECINACFDCAQICNICADACLAEPTVANLTRCIRINLDCYTICLATGTVLSRQTELEPGLLREQLKACIEACRVCATECEGHGAHMEHCRICAEQCRHCEAACRDLLDVV